MQYKLHAQLHEKYAWINDRVRGKKSIGSFQGTSTVFWRFWKDAGKYKSGVHGVCTVLDSFSRLGPTAVLSCATFSNILGPNGALCMVEGCIITQQPILSYHGQGGVQRNLLGIASSLEQNSAIRLSYNQHV
jgi:hypothetical protein